MCQPRYQYEVLVINFLNVSGKKLSTYLRLYCNIKVANKSFLQVTPVSTQKVPSSTPPVATNIKINRKICQYNDDQSPHDGSKATPYTNTPRTRSFLIRRYKIFAVDAASSDKPRNETKLEPYVMPSACCDLSQNSCSALKQLASAGTRDAKFLSDSV